MSRRRLEGMRVIVTGASSGIGAQLVRQLVERGALVVANARREHRLREVRDALGDAANRAHLVVGDVTDARLRSELIQTSIRELGGLDALINNAGIGALGDFAGASPERLRPVMEVNFFAPAELIRLALPVLRQGRDSLIVNIGSVLGHRAVPGKSEYCASKFALHGFSDALRAEVARLGIGVLHVCPSTTSSEFFDQVIADAGSQRLEPRRATRPEVVAAKTLRAMQRRKDEIIISLGGKGLVWIDRLCPTCANWLVGRFG